VNWVISFSKTTTQTEPLNFDEVMTNKESRRSLLPSHWSLALIVVPISLTVLLHYFDPIALLSDRDKLNWSDARRSRAFFAAQRSEIRISTSPRGKMISIDFHPEVDGDVLRSIDNKNVIQQLTIENNRPQIDYVMTNIPRRIFIKSGKITTAQIIDLQNLGCDVEMKGVGLFDVLAEQGSIWIGSSPRDQDWHLELICNQNTDGDILGAINSARFHTIIINRNKRNVDFSIFKNLKCVLIRDGEVTSTQIADICKKRGAVYLSRVEYVEESPKQIELDGLNFMRRRVKDEMTPSSYFSVWSNSTNWTCVIDEISGNENITVAELVNLFSLKHSRLWIDVIEGITDQDVDSLSGLPAGNWIYLNYDNFEGSVSEEWKHLERLILKSTSSIRFYGLPSRSEFLSRILMVAPDPGYQPFPFEVDSETFLAEYAHLLYQSPQDDEARYKVFLPTLSNASIRNVLNSGAAIRALSLDPEWCQFPISPKMDGEVEKLETVLEDFKVLEELYLSRFHNVDDLVFLSQLKQLKKLQIDLVSAVNLRDSAIDELTACSSIEELTLLTAPKSSTVLQLKSLANLKHLVIIDRYYAYASPDKTEQEFRDALPGVEIEIINPGNTKQLIPQEFRDHIARLRAEAANN